ncbi:MAG: hypothetical protein J7L71_05825 [Spirochaetaceae bacterium]|nr:hypothetical protein [Spirochaetaceae bacterium]
MKTNPVFQNFKQTSIKNIITKEIILNKNLKDLADFFINKKGTILLLSGGEHKSARYNILISEPWLEISSRGSEIIIKQQGEITKYKVIPLMF